MNIEDEVKALKNIAAFHGESKFVPPASKSDGQDLITFYTWSPKVFDGSYYAMQGFSISFDRLAIPGGYRVFRGLVRIADVKNFDRMKRCGKLGCESTPVLEMQYEHIPLGMRSDDFCLLTDYHKSPGFTITYNTITYNTITNSPISYTSTGTSWVSSTS